MKIIKNYSDFEIPIKVYGSNGFLIDPQDASTLDISVFTTDVSTCLVYDKGDIDVSTRTIAVDGQDASILENGVLYYQYHLVMQDLQYPDHNYTADKLCQTDIYIQNEAEEHKHTCATMVSELYNDAGYITRIEAVPIINAQVDARVDYDISTRLDNYATKAYVDLSVNLVRSEIPTIPTKVSAFENDKGYLTQHQSLDAYATKVDLSTGLSNKQAVLVSGTNIKTINGQSILGPGNIDVSGGSIDPQDLSIYATKQWVENKGYLTQHQDISGKADKSYVDGSINAVKAMIPDVSGYATKSWVEGKGYLTQHQDISGKADKSYVDNNFIDNSTFTENNEVVSAAINQLIRNKADRTDISAFITGNDVSVFAKTSDVSTALSGKQATLVSGVNIKTINGQDVLGSGNLVIDGSGTIDLSIYATKGYVDASVQAVRNEIPSLNGYATEQWVNNKGYLVQNDISAFTTQNYVDNKVNSSLVGYATQQWVGSQNYLKSNDVSTFTTKEYVDASVQAVRNEIPSLNGYATEIWVQNQGYLTQHQDISGKADKSYVDGSINKLREEMGDISTYATKQWVEDKHYLVSNDISAKADKSYVDGSINAVKAQIPVVPTVVSAFTNDVGYLTAHQSLDNYATKQYVLTESARVEALIPDVSPYATKTYVDSSLVLKQDVLVSGTNIKTINNQNILGSGNIDISAGGVTPQDLSIYATKAYVDSSFLPRTGGMINGNVNLNGILYFPNNTWILKGGDDELRVRASKDIVLCPAGNTDKLIYQKGITSPSYEVATVNDISTFTTKSYVDSSFLPLTGGTVNGNVNVQNGWYGTQLTVDNSTYGNYVQITAVGSEFKHITNNTTDAALRIHPSGVYERTSGSEGTDFMTATEYRLVGSNQVNHMWVGTQAEYNAIVSKDPSTFYIIKAS